MLRRSIANRDSESVLFRPFNAPGGGGRWGRWRHALHRGSFFTQYPFACVPFITFPGSMGKSAGAGAGPSVCWCGCTCMQVYWTLGKTVMMEALGAPSAGPYDVHRCALARQHAICYCSRSSSCCAVSVSTSPAPTPTLRRRNFRRCCHRQLQMPRSVWARCCSSVAAPPAHAAP